MHEYVRELLLESSLFILYLGVPSWSHLQCSDSFFVRVSISNWAGKSKLYFLPVGYNYTWIQQQRTRIFGFCSHLPDEAPSSEFIILDFGNFKTQHRHYYATTEYFITNGMPPWKFDQNTDPYVVISYCSFQTQQSLPATTPESSKKLPYKSSLIVTAYPTINSPQVPFQQYTPTPSRHAQQQIQLGSLDVEMGVVVSLWNACIDLFSNSCLRLFKRMVFLLVSLETHP